MPYKLRPRLATLFLAAISTLILSGCGDQPEQNTTSKPSTTDTSSEMSHDHSKHHHGLLDIETFGENTPVPAVSFTITPDPMSGWNVLIKADNFTFTPEKVNQDASANEGHAHIFVDGFKMGRIYSEWYHLKKLTPGEHEVQITLNANDHSAWASKGVEIDAKTTIFQP